jgi:hypothetical protein
MFKKRQFYIFLLSLFFIQANGSAQSGKASAETKRPVTSEEGWAIHQVENTQTWLPNALAEADINKDGLPDYVTNYEWRGEIRIFFHPGWDKVKEVWPMTELTKRPQTDRFPIMSNIENVAVADFDGDSNMDVVSVTGSERPIIRSALRMFWGPASDKVYDPAAWKDGGFMRPSFDLGHMHYTRAKDINGDGAPDILVGGRKHEVYGDYAGLKWFEAPKDSAKRRDLSQWKVHYISKSIVGSYGATFGDFDGDGDEDITLATADFDTKPEDQKLVWFENPGAGTEQQKNEWKEHVLYQAPVFYGKPHVDVKDLNGDGRMDIVAPTHDNILFFKNLGGTPVRFETIIIKKDPVAQWNQRGTKLVDINGDGKMDIVGLLVWKKTDSGNLVPKDKAAIYWMEYNGKEPAANNWTTHVIKWGSNFVGHNWWGEKWDQSAFYDLDKDGDLDMIANVEEMHDEQRVYYTVVWFENPGSKNVAKTR